MQKNLLLLKTKASENQLILKDWGVAENFNFFCKSMHKSGKANCTILKTVKKGK